MKKYQLLNRCLLDVRFVYWHFLSENASLCQGDVATGKAGLLNSSKAKSPDDVLRILMFC